MKKLFTLLLALLLCFSLAGCSSKEADLYNKYKDIIDALESENYDYALFTISEMIPEPEVNEIVLTPDNFFDYFESKFTMAYNVNGFGEKEYTGWVYQELILKDEYADKIDQAHQEEIAVEYSGIINYQKINVDVDNVTFEITDELCPWADENGSQISETTSLFPYIEGFYGYMNTSSYSGDYYAVISDLSIARVLGSLALLAD